MQNVNDKVQNMKMIKRKTRFLKNEKGSVMLFSILLMTLFFVIISSLVVITVGEMRQTTQIEDSSSAYLAAEAGFERAQNYVKNTTEVNNVGEVNRQKLRDGAKAPTYEFQVKKAAAGATYDGGRKCDNTITNPADPEYKGGENLFYCFFSLGRSGTTIRKLDGVTKIRRIEQGVVIDFSTYVAPPSTQPDIYTAWPWDTSYPNVKFLNITPAEPKTNTFTLVGEIITQNMATSESYYFGLLDKETVGMNREGVGVRVYRVAGDSKARIELIGLTRTTTLTVILGNGNIPSNNTTISSLSDKVTFTLTYRRSATDSNNHTVTLQVNDTSSGTCLGVKTTKFSQNIFSSDPFYAVFFPGGSYFNKQPVEVDNGNGVTSLSIPSDTINKDIKLQNFIFNTSGQ